MEAIVVMVLTSILAATVAVFIRAPVQAYFDGVRRADLSDAADGVLRRMSRDLQTALPNSVRISGNFIEFVPVTDAGRYRTDADPTAGCNSLDFSSSSLNSFDVLGPAVAVAAGNGIVVYNLGQPGADVYEGSSIRVAGAPSTPQAACGAQTIIFPAGTAPYSFASPGARFQVITTPVSYECAPDAANPDNGVLRRYWGYAIQATQPASAATLTALPNARSAIAAGQLASCVISYSNEVLQRNGLVVVRLTLSKGGESVTLVQQMNVANTP